jgi:nucleoside phosphorylase
LLMKEFAPALVLRIGRCGVLANSDLAVGECMLGFPSVFFISRRITLSRRDEDYGLGEAGVWPQVRRIYDEIQPRFNKTLRLGKIGSGSSFDPDSEDMKYFMAHGGKSCGKDMESSSIAWVCSLFGVQFSSMLLVSNVIAFGAATKGVGESAQQVVDLQPLLGVLPTFLERALQLLPLPALSSELVPWGVCNRVADRMHSEAVGRQVQVHQERRTIGLVVAMEQELLPLAAPSVLNLHRTFAVPSFNMFGVPAFVGTLQCEGEDVQVIAVTHGFHRGYSCTNRVGPEVATLVTSLLLQVFPNCIGLVNAGTAGAFMHTKAGGEEVCLDIADVVLASQVVFTDRRVKASFPCQAFQEYAVGGFECWSRTDELCKALALAGSAGGVESGDRERGENALERELVSTPAGLANSTREASQNRPTAGSRPRLRRGIVGTGSSFDLSDADVQMMSDLGVSVKEMEAAAIAWVAQAHRSSSRSRTSASASASASANASASTRLQGELPLVVLKAITDHVGDEGGAQDFVANTNRCMIALSHLLPAVLKEMASMLCEP